jgi:hypothetical protein
MRATIVSCVCNEGLSTGHLQSCGIGNILSSSSPEDGATAKPLAYPILYTGKHHLIPEHRDARTHLFDGAT